MTTCIQRLGHVTSVSRPANVSSRSQNLNVLSHSHLGCWGQRLSLAGEGLSLVSVSNINV